MLSMYVSDNHRSWDENLDQIACAIRTSKHEVTKLTPYFVNFGRNMNLSGKDYSRPNLLDVEDGTQTNEVCRNESLKGMFADVRKRLETAAQKSCEQYNLRRRHVEYLPNQLVWKRNFSIGQAIQCETIESLESIFEAIFVVAYSDTEGVNVEGQPTTCELKKNWLKRRVASGTIEPSIETIIESENENLNTEVAELLSENEDGAIDNFFVKWVTNIAKLARLVTTNANEEGDRGNQQVLPGFVDDMNSNRAQSYTGTQT
ncbi:hypothetical protein NQ315_008987 [Exocentrus adspersus]|uniref:Reverse transcriptase domain-containing protein n=1 Tax=Exocentrus adspersus TaxID=1586481 RepID=A0AAV8V7S6_9CUCU|nr:hypothetical protein NQ315_008987 [Exocentrus adspersus]